MGRTKSPKVLTLKQIVVLPDGALIGLSEDGTKRYVKTKWGWVVVGNDDVEITLKQAQAFAAKEEAK